MSDPIALALVALACPLAAAVVCAVMGCVKGCRDYAHLPAILAFAASAVASILLLMNLAGAEQPSAVSQSATWFSAGYMHHDPGFARYFALMSLFVFSMCLLVLAGDFLLLLAGWEGVGVCSYLLVGYYYAKPSAAAAARKAFLVTRLGDVGFVLGIFLLWQNAGFTTDIGQAMQHLADNRTNSATATAAALLLFCGAVGKSAQLPLYVWLPDAMEGPTPVSALIHAATMVTAGVYLLARTAPLFVLSPDAQITVTLIGAATALLAAFLALAQNDLKRVLAYSTVSQLGYMFMALGAGGAVAPSVCVAAAMFHFFTHAFFKALLFLGSGSVMHAMGNVIDMRRFGGLAKLMPVTRWTFLVGACALAGLPIFAGFWSKDQILDVLYQAGFGEAKPYRAAYGFAFGVAVLTAFLTAFYTFRAYFLTFHGELRVPAEAGDHAHESPTIMLIPLIVLAIGAAFAGVAVEPFGHHFSDFLAEAPPVQLASAKFPEAHPHFDPVVAAIGTVAALLGVGLAWRLNGTGGPEVTPAALRGVYEASRSKLYVDELYAGAFVKPAEGLALLARAGDPWLGGLARFVGSLPELTGRALRPVQNGLVQFYALGMTLGLAAVLAVVVFRAN